MNICLFRKGAQRSRHLDEPAIQLEPRVHPLGGDFSRWHGVNFGRRAVEDWERTAALTNVSTPLSFWCLPIPISSVLTRVFLFIWTQDLPTDPVASEPKTTASEPETTASEPKTTASEPGQPSSAPNEPENLAGIKRSGGSEGSAECQHKATLKEKISGGMKVVSGKLGHDKSKVEEGKKLMHGQSA